MAARCSLVYALSSFSTLLSTHCSLGTVQVTLRFMALEDASALRNYLKKKLETLKSGEKTQITLIVIWLVEIYQNKLGALREGGAEVGDLQT